jgi:hypothetical protein
VRKESEIVSELRRPLPIFTFLCGDPRRAFNTRVRKESEAKDQNSIVVLKLVSLDKVNLRERGLACTETARLLTLGYTIFPLLPPHRPPHFNRIGTCGSWLCGHFRLGDSAIESRFGRCGLDDDS